MSVFRTGGFYLRAAFLIAGCLLPLGCGDSSGGPEVYPVSGEVFLNGKPATGALVHFHPLNDEERSPAYATVQEDGSFQLSTFDTNDGAEVGDYVVTLNWRDEERVDGEMINGPDHFGDRFSTRQKSTLKATIEPGENVVPRFDIVVDKPAQASGG